MAEFKSKEEYEKWKANRKKQAEATIASPSVDDNSLSMNNLSNNKSASPNGKGISYGILISIILVVLVCGVGGTYFFMRTPTNNNQVVVVSANNSAKQSPIQGIDVGLKDQVVATMKNLDDIKYGFKVGMSYNDFKRQNFEIQKNIERIQDNFSTSVNLSDSSNALVSSLVGAKLSANVLDCIWQNKIKTSTQVVWSITHVFDPDAGVSLCVTDYTVGKSNLKERPFYKDIYSKLDNYEKVIIPQRRQEGDRAIDIAKNSRYPDYSIEENLVKLQVSLFGKYLADFMQMYNDEVDKIQLAVK